jgi:hypothetical protein
LAGDAAQEGAWVPSDPFDVSLEDVELLEEVELTTSLIVVATQANGRLSQQQIDTVLGVVVPLPRSRGRSKE